MQAQAILSPLKSAFQAAVPHLDLSKKIPPRAVVLLSAANGLIAAASGNYKTSLFFGLGTICVLASKNREIGQIYRDLPENHQTPEI